ncbi:MAG: hypothetical protein JWO36_2020 [Myxococcales bacterium]|nr:hypothetical protein [Myxococcales bacterium]
MKPILERVVCVWVVVVAHLASADPHHVLVLRSEGSIDDGLRTRIDTQVLKLAKSIPGVVEAADITFSDATAAAGCNWADASCKDQVLSTMGVDELVATSVMSLPSGDLRITVRRLPRGGAPQTASTTIPAGQPPDAKLNGDIAPMFGAVVAATKTPPPVPALKPPTTPVTTPSPTKPATTPVMTATVAPVKATTTTPPATGTGAISTGSPPPPETPPPVISPPPTPTPEVTAAPDNRIIAEPEPSSRRRWPIYGMAGGGGLVVLGVLLWAAADSVQGDINKAPTKTPADFRNLRDLENKADGYSGGGNLFFVTGVVLGGISGYMFWRDHRAGSSQRARIVPVVFENGAGITLSFGGGS